MPKKFKSIITSNAERCFLCGRSTWIEIHHIFSGCYRKKSTLYGLVVPLCHFCHNEPPNGVHFNRANMDKLRAIGQKKFQEVYPELNFIKIFGRNYLTEETEKEIPSINLGDEEDEKN